MFVGVSVIVKLLFNRKRKQRRTRQLCENTCFTPVLQAILNFFPDIISFQHVFHLGVGRSQIEWKLKVKTQISVFPWANIGQNDYSNPYIESTIVLSDIHLAHQSSLPLSIHKYSSLVPRLLLRRPGHKVYNQLSYTYSKWVRKTGGLVIGQNVQKAKFIYIHGEWYPSPVI